MEIDTSKVMWAYLTAVSYHPNALTFSGQLDFSNIQFARGCCCFDYLLLDWSACTLLTHQAQIINLPSRASVILHHTDLHALRTNGNYEVTLQARFLGQIYKITQLEHFTSTADRPPIYRSRQATPERQLTPSPMTAINLV
jgi:hypothetical protein